MKTSRIVWIIVAVFLILFIFRGCNRYNDLVTRSEQVSSSWSNVENVYQRRADLIPNLVNTVKGYATHEQETFTRVTEARSKATQVTIDAANMTDEDLKRFQAAQGEISSTLKSLLAVAEAYPDLKANQNFLELQSQLEGTENRIAVERRNFNEATRSYNTARRRFPAILYAGILGFDAKPYFEAQAGTEEAPVVQF
jgi:LemA protein